jgi:hypothetical protein
MVSYFCAQCGEQRKDNPCEVCGATTTAIATPEVERPLKISKAVQRPSTPPPSRPDVRMAATLPPDEKKVSPPTPEPRPAAAVQTPPTPEPAEKRVPTPESGGPTDAAHILGLAKFERFIKRDGYLAVPICGRPKSGKSHILEGFLRAWETYRGKSHTRTFAQQTRTRRSVGGTSPDHVWYQPVDADRKVVFLDPSGEFFKKISV